MRINNFCWHQTFCNVTEICHPSDGRPQGETRKLVPLRGIEPRLRG